MKENYGQAFLCSPLQPKNEQKQPIINLSPQKNQPQDPNFSDGGCNSVYLSI